MSTTQEKSKSIHQGRNVKRFREMLGWKQEALALELGDDWSQRRVSLLEAKEVIEEDLLIQVAHALKVPVESIKSFDEEAAVNIINSTFTSNDNSTSIAYQSNFTFNPIDKVVELFEENKKLYERLLASEQEKVQILKNKAQ